MRKKRAKIVRRIKQVSKGSCNKISGVQSAQRENQEDSSPKSSSMRQKTDFAAFFWVQHRSQRQNKLEMAFFVLLSASIDCLQRKFAKNGEEIALKGVWRPFFSFSLLLVQDSVVSSKNFQQTCIKQRDLSLIHLSVAFFVFFAAS